MAKAPAFKPTANMRIVLLYGKEPFLLREHTRELVEMLEAAHGDIEQFVHDGRNASLAEILDDLRSYGLMSSYKLVILDHADAFVASTEDRTKRTGLENYAKNPVDHATLLMRAETWRKGNLDKLIAKIGAVHQATAPSIAVATTWCIKRAEKRHERAIDRNAAALLVDRIGAQLGRLDTELAKLAASTADGQIITREAVIDLVGVSREEQAWELQGPIAAGRPAEAIAKLRELRQVSQAPAELLFWSLMDLARKLHAASRLLREGQSPGAIRGPLRLFGESELLILGAARALEPARAAQLLHAAVDADRRRKWGIGDEARSLEALTVQIADTIGSAQA